MDLLAELEAMALNIADFSDDDTITDEDVERWQLLFGYKHAKAVRRLEEYRTDYSRRSVPDDLWATVCSQKEAEGYDREAYEYSLTLQSQPVVCDAHISPDLREGAASGMFIMKLEDPFETPEKIQVAAGLDHTPECVAGEGEVGVAEFCRIDYHARSRLMAWIAEHQPGVQPTIVRLASPAKKNLSSSTMAPFLGQNPATTVPCPGESTNFETSLSSMSVPTQNQYPVWYFFYGTLAEPEVLTRQLGLTVEPDLIPAHVEGGRLRRWGGKYKALVDGTAESKVFGSAFLVGSADHENALRFYETDKYEVVRCSIITADETIQGLTFRFAGPKEALDDEIHQDS
ncbi:hypothetical protein HRR83_005699 [Exophiala dermatitidis]|uniref:Putative gamma-glutamylcyclotransferase n=1 Tax=Exophiala dermatitidis TaxID=5970 RepID=A0AAN6IQS3_EXODE|nr:hypothetical protein HRR73_007469 [Exophiala dermatitidis]KAJ4513255.1 hypothetical protein HRR74_006067 [Exophiala dermatitidis]KAJ4532038.1 hypothetical protein HRR77_008998 [Exophiala dermatitidis]KAJ4539935.1 hypothetical protein HRR76_003360 [Exophiala dermatitidis]KAJ4554882.1 hypothetical protein HRR79_009165 [Exophiala dermatitidis]